MTAVISGAGSTPNLVFPIGTGGVFNPEEILFGDASIVFRFISQSRIETIDFAATQGVLEPGQLIQIELLLNHRLQEIERFTVLTAVADLERDLKLQGVEPWEPGQRMATLDWPRRKVILRVLSNPFPVLVFLGIIAFNVALALIAVGGTTVIISEILEAAGIEVPDTIQNTGEAMLIIGAIVRGMGILHAAGRIPLISVTASNLVKLTVAGGLTFIGGATIFYLLEGDGRVAEQTFEAIKQTASGIFAPIKRLVTETGEVIAVVSEAGIEIIKFLKDLPKAAAGVGVAVVLGLAAVGGVLVLSQVAKRRPLR